MLPGGRRCSSAHGSQKFQVTIDGHARRVVSADLLRYDVTPAPVARPTTPAVARILSETSAYYLLGVKTADADRDGRVHGIKVKVSEPKTTIRARSFVWVPKQPEREAGD